MENKRSAQQHAIIRHRSAQLLAPYIEFVVPPDAADIIDACQDADNLGL